MKRLSENESIYWVAVASGNYLYVGCYLRNIVELEHTAEYIREKGEMFEPRVGIVNWGTGSYRAPEDTLDALD